MVGSEGSARCSAFPGIREPWWLLQTRENPQESVEPGKRAALKGHPICLTQEVCSVRNRNRECRKPQMKPHHCAEPGLRTIRGQCGFNTDEQCPLKSAGTQIRAPVLFITRKIIHPAFQQM